MFLAPLSFILFIHRVNMLLIPPPTYSYHPLALALAGHLAFVLWLKFPLNGALVIAKGIFDQVINIPYPFAL